MANEKQKQALKTGLGRIQGSIFEPTTPAPKPEPQPLEPRKSVGEVQLPLPKVNDTSKGQLRVEDQFPQKVLVNMTYEQKDLIDSFARKVTTASRASGGSRGKDGKISSHAVIRCLIDSLKGFDGDLSGIRNEDELREWFSRRFNGR